VRALYSIGWLFATPLVIGYLLWRACRQPAYLGHWSERFGLHPRRGDDRPLIWIHAVSVGETRAAQPLVKAIAAAHPEAVILLTCMTPTGRETGQALYGDSVVSAYLPYDYAGAQRRFLRAWRPALGLVMETELWPNLMAAAEREGVPVALVNARLSERSLARGMRQRRLVVPAARRLALVLAQSEGDAQRVARLGRPADAVTGNLKFDNAPDEALLARGRTWRDRIGRPVLLAASTREGEEPLVWEAWRRAAASPPEAVAERPDADAAERPFEDAAGRPFEDAAGRPDEAAALRHVEAAAGRPGEDAAAAAVSSRGRPLLVIVPRHPQRFDEVLRAAHAAGFAVARRADLDRPGFDASVPDLLIGDSMGEMDAWYALADCALIGGSLMPFGSQNLIEACAAGCPVLVGPSSFNFEEAAAFAIEAGAALRVADAQAAVAAGLSLLGDAPRAQAMRVAGLRFASTHRGATRRTMAALSGLLERLGGRGPGGSA
jgi:3-deoxy-D-manno-octulosonic-acid transferase